MHNLPQYRAVIRTISLAASAAALIGAGTTPAQAQNVDFPQTIRIVVPFGPGGTTDLYARAIADKLGQRLQRTVIVENKPGANGWIGTRQVAAGPKDGSVLMSYTMSLVTNAASTPNAGVDVMKTLVPVAIMSEFPLLVAASVQSGIRTPAQLVAAARSKPTGLTYATGGAGTTVHMVTELLADQAKIKLTHIPYKGGAAANTDVAAGHVDFTMAAPGTLLPLITAGRMTAVAISTLQPAPAFPGIPTLSSVVPGFEAGVWTALWAPIGTPSALIQRLNKEVMEIVRAKDFEKLLKDDGAVILDLTPAQAAEKAARAYTLWKDLATAKGIEVQP